MKSCRIPPNVVRYERVNYGEDFDFYMTTGETYRISRDRIEDCDGDIMSILSLLGGQENNVNYLGETRGNPYQRPSTQEMYEREIAEKMRWVNEQAHKQGGIIQPEMSPKKKAEIETDQEVRRREVLLLL